MFESGPTRPREGDIYSDPDGVTFTVERFETLERTGQPAARVVVLALGDETHDGIAVHRKVSEDQWNQFQAQRCLMRLRTSADTSPAGLGA